MGPAAAAALLALVVGAATAAEAGPAEPPYAAGAAAAWAGLPVASLKVTGLPDELAGPLRRGLVLASDGGPLFHATALDGDLRRARLFLARRGHPRAVLRVTLEEARKGRAVAVTLAVAPGPPVRVRDVALEGFPEDLREEARGGVRTVAGQVHDDDLIEADRQALAALLREAGHADARVDLRVSWTDSTLVDATFVATPGSVNRFGVVDPGPIGDDLAPLVRRTAGLRRGDRYSPRALLQAEENIRRLELFRQIRLGTRPAAAETLDVAAELLPAPMRTLSAGVGWWTDEQLRLAAAWKHRNLLRAGRGLSARASYSRFRQDLALTAWRPSFPGPRSGVSLSMELSREAEETYTLRSARLTASLTWRPTFVDVLGLSLSGGRQFLDVETESSEAFRTGDGNLTLLTGTWSRDSADDRLNPTRGGATRARVAWTPPSLLSDFHFVTAELEQVRYRQLGRAVLAARANLGWGRPLEGDPDLPPNARFFAGGSTSMRGFKRRRLAPVDAAGEPLGGEARLLASVEARVPVAGPLRAAFFVDAGQAWARRDHVNLDRVEVAAGPGLMVNTMVGPVRADVGFRLTDVVPGQPRQVLHVSIGHPF